MKGFCSHCAAGLLPVLALIACLVYWYCLFISPIDAALSRHRQAGASGGSFVGYHVGLVFLQVSMAHCNVSDSSMRMEIQVVRKQRQKLQSNLIKTIHSIQLLLSFQREYHIIGGILYGKMRIGAGEQYQLSANIGLTNIQLTICRCSSQSQGSLIMIAKQYRQLSRLTIQYSHRYSIGKRGKWQIVNSPGQILSSFDLISLLSAPPSLLYFLLPILLGLPVYFATIASSSHLYNHFSRAQTQNDPESSATTTVFLPSFHPNHVFSPTSNFCHLYRRQAY